MKVNHTRKRNRSAFTLIEMIGVLAVIAILAALLIPKVFAAINSAKISNTSTSLNTVKTAAIDHYAKFGSLPVDGSSGTPVAMGTMPTNQFDKILLSEGFLDKMFAVKIGDGTTNTTIQLTTSVASTAPPTGGDAGAGNSAYNLDGDDTTGVNDATGSHVLHAIIANVSLADARDLNRVIDGTDSDLGEAGPGGSTTAGAESDISGRVKYTFSGATTDVYVYLTHR